MMMKFILRLAILLLPLLIVVLSINMSQDPGAIESKRYLQIKDLIIENKNVQLFSFPSEWGNYHEVFLEERKKRKLPPFDVMTWGSSRSSEIRDELFPSHTYYNCAIPGSSVLDYVALYGLYKKNNYLPKTIVLNIDPWAFYKRKIQMSHGRNYFIHDPTRSLTAKESLDRYLSQGLQAIGYPESPKQAPQAASNTFSRYVEWVSPSYFQASLRVMSMTAVAPTTEEYIQGYFVLRKDGSYTVDRPDPRQLMNVEAKALYFTEIAKGDFYCDSCAAGENMDILVALLDQLKKENIRVILFVCPVHPILYEAFKDSEQNLLEQKLRSIAAEKQLILVGAFDPKPYGLKGMVSDPDFVDEYHISYKATKTIFNKHQQEIDRFLSY